MTLDLLEEVQYDGIFAFKYSKRPGTAALMLPDHVREQVKEARLARVLDLQRSITIEKNKKSIGTKQEILIDGFSKKGGTMCGRTRSNKVVNVESPATFIGSIITTIITSAGVNSLTGQICE